MPAVSLLTVGLTRFGYGLSIIAILPSFSNGLAAWLQFGLAWLWNRSVTLHRNTHDGRIFKNEPTWLCGRHRI